MCRLRGDVDPNEPAAAIVFTIGGVLLVVTFAMAFVPR